MQSRADIERGWKEEENPANKSMQCDKTETKTDRMNVHNSR